MPELSVIIPVYNNENSIQVLVSSIGSALKDRNSYQLILVNDGSSDRSWEIISDCINGYSGNNTIMALDLKKNYGQENAKLAGLKNATGEFIAFMDADFQHNPEHLLLLLDECKNGSDVCYANFNNPSSGTFKLFGSWFYNYMATKLLNKPKGIYLSSYNMISKNIADEVIMYTSPIVNIDAMVLRHAKKVSQLFVQQNKSMNKKINYTPMKMVDLFFRLLPGFSTLPLRIILILGSLISCGGIFLLITKEVLGIFASSLHFPIQTNTLIISCLGGMILFAMGVIGEYMGKIYTILHTDRQFEIQTTITTQKK